MLRTLSEHVPRRPLMAAELRCLTEYALGLWSDGMGECVFVPSGPFEGDKLQPLGEHETDAPEYPFIEVIGARFHATYEAADARPPVKENPAG